MAIENAHQAMTAAAGALIQAAAQIHDVSSCLEEGTVVLRDAGMVRAVTFTFDPFTGSVELQVSIRPDAQDDFLQPAPKKPN